MAREKGGGAGGMGLLLLSLLSRRDMYGYEMIEELRLRSNETFTLKAGTLYPLLHTLETEGLVSSRDESADGNRVRRYYHLTAAGGDALRARQSEWEHYVDAVNGVLGGEHCGA